MARQRFVSSVDVAAESLRTGRVVIESMPRRTERVRRWRGGLTDAYLAAPGDRRAADAVDNPCFMFTYGAGGVEFTVCVHERKRWYVTGDEDGLSVMAGDRGETYHHTARFADLPAPVRAVARDIRAAMLHDQTAGERARDRRWSRRMAELDARIAGNGRRAVDDARAPR